MAFDQEHQEQEREMKRKPHALAASRGGPLTKSDGLFRIVGIGKSNVAGGYSWRKHELLGGNGESPE